jgi:hypothetical protein
VPVLGRSRETWHQVTGAARTIEGTAAVGGRSKLVDLEKLVLFAIVCTRTAYAAFQRSRIFSGRIVAVWPLIATRLWRRGVVPVWLKRSEMGA